MSNHIEQQIAAALHRPCEHKGWRPCEACQAERIAGALTAAIEPPLQRLTQYYTRAEVGLIVDEAIAAFVTYLAGEAELR